MPSAMDRVRRAELAGARDLATLAGQQWDLHVKVCTTCRKMHPGAARYCDDGWELAKTRHAARQRVARLEAAEIPGQAPMF